MEYLGLRRSSKTFNSLVTTIEETRVVDLNEEHEITIDAVDRLIHFILRKLKLMDPKFNFNIRNLSSLDSDNKTIRQYHYFLIWKELSKPNVSRLANDDGYFSSIELLKDPKSWSKYDLDAHVIKIERKKYLNGLSLRDDLVKSLMELLKNNIHQDFIKDLHFKEIEFDQSIIRIIFTGKIKQSSLPTSVTPNLANTSTSSISNVNQSISPLDGGTIMQDDIEISVSSQTPTPQVTQQQQSMKATYVINLNAMISFSNANPILLMHQKENLEHHNIFKDYFENVFDPKFYLLPFNSFKWVYDVVYNEHLLFEYILEQKSVFTASYKKLVTIRKSWRKYFQKVYKVVENIKINERAERRKSSFAVDRDAGMRTNFGMYNDANSLQMWLTYEFETAIERTLTEYLFRVLFLRHCSINKNLPDNREQFNSIIITNIFEDLIKITETKYCESFSFKYKNILPKCVAYFEPAIETGINKLIKEIYLDWKRGRFGH